MWLRISFNNIVFNPFDCVLLTIFLFALIFMYKWKRGKMPFPLMRGVPILLYLFSMIVVGLVSHELFPLIAVSIMWKLEKIGIEANQSTQEKLLC